MKILDRIGLALFSMLILTISIVLILIGIGIIDSTIFSVLIGKVLISQQHTYIMIGVSAILALLAVRCIFFGQDSSSNDEGVLLQNNDGKLMITKKTIENLVEGITEEFPSIENSDITVKFDKENNISISIILNVKEGTIIKDLSAKLQSKVKKNIKETTTLELKAVDIEIQKIEKKENDKPATKEDNNNKESD